MKIDLHGFRLFDAIEEIIGNLEDCQYLGDDILLIIHGYRNGQVLKNYFRSIEFLEDMVDEGYRLIKINHTNPGTSMFKLI